MHAYAYTSATRLLKELVLATFCIEDTVEYELAAVAMLAGVCEVHDPVFRLHDAIPVRSRDRP